jgi:hypothetical protein
MARVRERERERVVGGGGGLIAAAIQGRGRGPTCANRMVTLAPGGVSTVVSCARLGTRFPGKSDFSVAVVSVVADPFLLHRRRLVNL